MSTVRFYTGPTETDLRPNPDQILRQLDFWFGDQTKGEIDVGTYDGTDKLNVFQRFGLHELETLAEYACDMNRRPGRSMYFRPALVDENAPVFVKDKHFLRAPGIWCDLDKEGQAERASIVASTTRPNMVVITGRHPYVRAQMFWRTDEAITDPDTLRRLNSRASDLFGGDSLVINPTSLMRLAGTIAWPRKQGRVLELTDLKLFSDDRPKQYPVAAIERAFPQTERAETRARHDADPFHSFGGLVFSRSKLIAAIRRGENWHKNVLSLVARYVNSGLADEEILTLSEALTLPGYTVDQTRREVEIMIRGAREKWGIEEPSDEEQTVPDPEGRRLPLVWFRDINGTGDVADFVEGLLCEGAMSVVYGESNCGKTFFMTDLALHVALGRPWRDLDVEKGGVIYVALEGGHGINNRILAFKKSNGLENADIPFAVVPSAINMLDPDADTPRLIELVKEAAAGLNVPVRLIVIDTLSRALAGGNENAPDDMGALVMNADKVRQTTNAHLCFVHHSGKDQARGARGHSSLRAATDTEIEVVRDETTGVSVARVTKQRDLEIEGEFAFKLASVDLGMNRRNKPITSCVVAPTDATESRRPVKLTDNEMRALERLRAIMPEKGKIVTPTVTIGTVTAVHLEVWKSDLKDWDVTDRDSPANARQQFKRIRDGLVNKGKIGVFKDFIWLA